MFSRILCTLALSFSAVAVAAPVVVCRVQVNAAVGNDCTVDIVANMLDQGSYDPGGAALTMWTTGGNDLAPGTHYVNLVVSNGTATNQCRTRVVVEDKTAPEATCRTQEVYLVAPDQPFVLYAEDMVTVTDNCGASVLGLSVVDMAGYGSYPYGGTAEDAHGNTDRCTGTVIVRDAEPQNYCTPSRNAHYEHIAKLSLQAAGETQTVSSGNDGGYRQHLPVGVDNNLYHGYTYSLSYLPGFTYGSYHEYWSVYLDKNGDGDFTDSGELLHRWNGYGGNSFSFVSPGTVWGWSRIRVVMSYGGYGGPCDYGYGEVEDLHVYLRPLFVLPFPGWPFGIRTADQAATTRYVTPVATRRVEDKPVEPARPGEFARRGGLSDPGSPRTATPAAAASVNVFPNPGRAGQPLTLTGLEATTREVQLLDLGGRVLRRQALPGAGSRQDFSLPSDLPAGTYLLRGRGGREWVRRIIVR